MSVTVITHQVIGAIFERHPGVTIVADHNFERGHPIASVNMKKRHKVN